MKHMIPKSFLWAAIMFGMGILHLDAETLLIYRDDSMERPIVINRQYALADGGWASEVYLCKSLTMRRYANMVALELTNVMRFRTQVLRDSATGGLLNPSQEKMKAGTFAIDLAATNVIIYNGITSTLGNVKTESVDVGRDNAGIGVLHEVPQPTSPH